MGTEVKSNVQPTFVVNTPIRDLREYRALAGLASRLKRHGRVEINISTLAEKSRYEIPAGGSPWHEYAACNPTPAKFFPDKIIAPYIPGDFVARNRELLLAKAKILREMDLGAAFWSYEPNFLPEPFFQEHPHLRGPRTDHPRRSKREEFAPCIDELETREMTERMIAELVQHVPELGTYFFKTNDAGPGLCWSDWQYSGANGPARCRSKPVGKRVRDLMNSILRGGEKGGKKLTVHMTGNFSRNELEAIRPDLPTNTFVRSASKDSVAIGCCADQCYPVRGVLDVVGVVSALQNLKRGHVPTVFVDLRSFYDRGYEHIDTSAKIIETIDEFMTAPTYGPLAVMQQSHQMCGHWTGTHHAAALFEAMVRLHEVLKYKQAALPRLSAIYGGVSLRYITRPLVALPEKLSAEEEAYFLPHVFNVSHERARLDYIDVHGTRITPEWMTLDDIDPRIWAVYTTNDRLKSIAEEFEKLSDIPGGAYWKQTGTAIRIYGNILRSCGNFFAMQIVRDRNTDRFAIENFTSPARGSSTGHPDLALINELMRDELDNAAELAKLLKSGGLDVLSHAEKPDDEDTFLLGPDVIAQIERKQAIMREHWLDAQAFFVTPNK